MDDYLRIELLRDIINEWGNTHLRNYKWRETDNPYIILTTEIMLQRTQSDKVAEIYETFFSLFPDINSLINSKISEVQDTIKPLGLNNRVYRIIAMANFIMTKFDSVVPSSVDELVGIPGVGHYVAGMVQMCAFNKHSWALDTNIIRIFTRVMGLNISKDTFESKELIQLSKYYFDTDQSRITAYSILDFGALVCKSIIPKCLKCPVAKYGICSYR